jgi:glycogen synthase
MIFNIAEIYKDIKNKGYVLLDQYGKQIKKEEKRKENSIEETQTQNKEEWYEVIIITKRNNNLLNETLFEIQEYLRIIRYCNLKNILCEFSIDSHKLIIKVLLKKEDIIPSKLSSLKIYKFN